ncbi:MAG: sigma-54-dependent transcriptional regulator [Myxococcota bacterium]
MLFVDDDAEMCDLVRTALGAQGYDISTSTAAGDALRRALEDDVDAVVTDLNMASMGGIDLCQRIHDSRPDVPVIVVTAFGSLDNAIEAIRAGAYDFVTKPVEMETLAIHVNRALEHRRLSEEVSRLRRRVREAEGFRDIIGGSGSMKDVFDLMERVARTDVNVLITGETGTGKEIVARGIHQASDRRGGPFIAINCAAVPETLLESELFGHSKGAFTGAKGSRQGLFLTASGGTLLLDEIGEMTPAMQAKLLRAIQERKLRPVGESREVPFDTRILASTNRDLESDIEEGKFREDLFYRLNVVNIHVPPLRQRGNDILLLAQDFIDRFSERHGVEVQGLTTAAAEKLANYSWPGNVRELENCMERAVALARYEEIGVDDLPEKIRDYTPTRLHLVGDDPSDFLPMKEVERRYVLRVLEAMGGNKTLAAKVLGFDRKTLYRKLNRYGVED